MTDSIRLNRTMAHIEANLSLWNQTYWATETECGTAYCFAGWALQLDGIRICTADCDNLGGPHVHRDEVPGSVLERIHCPHPIMSVPRVARAVLKLNADQAWTLFCGCNSLDDLRWKISTMTRHG